MRIAYLGTARPSLSGGMISVLLTVHALRRLGHDAHVVATEQPPDWAPVRVPWVVRADPAGTLAESDAVVTGWSGARLAIDAGVPVVAQMCAGYEKHLWPQFAAEIEAAYRLPTLKLVIAPHLTSILRDDLGLDSVFVGTALELSWFRDGAPDRSPGAAPRILSVGTDPTGGYAPVPFKGIATVLELVARLRDAGHRFELVRLAPRYDSLMGSDQVDERRVGVAPRDAPSVYRSCDLFVSASTVEEGLGKPAIEAAASGLASVLPEIPSYAGIAELREAALFYPPGDLDEAARQVERLFDDRSLRRRLQQAGPRLPLDDLFDPIAVASRVASALEDAARRA